MAFIGQKAIVTTVSGNIFEGIVKDVVAQDKKIILRQVKDCSTGKSMRKDVHFFGNEIKDLKLHNDNEEIGAIVDNEDHEIEVLRNNTKQDTIVLDSSDVGPDLLQRKPLDPSLYLSGYDECFEGPPLYEPPDGLVIDSLKKEFYDAIQMIKSQKVISFAAEGRKINRFGVISIVIFGTRGKVYLFDIHSLGKEGFDEGIKDILTDGNILKVVHDIRLVSDCLNTVYNVKPINIFDTQVADAFIYKKNNGTFPKEVSSFSFCVENYLSISPATFEREKMRSAQNRRDIYTERPIDVQYRDCCCKIGMYLRELRPIMLRKMIADFLLGVDIYLDCVRDMSNHAVKLFNPSRVPKEFSKISHENARRNVNQQRQTHLNDNQFDSTGDERSKIRSQWDSGRDFTEERHERHGEIIDCMDGKTPLFDTTKPLLKSNKYQAGEKTKNGKKSNCTKPNQKQKSHEKPNRTYEKPNSHSSHENGKVDKKKIDPPYQQSAASYKRSSNDEDMFASLKSAVNPLQTFIKELSVNQESEHHYPKYSQEDYRMSTSDSDESDFFISSINDKRQSKSAMKKIEQTTDRPKISPAGHRMLMNNLRQYEETSSVSLSEEEFPSIQHSNHMSGKKKTLPPNGVPPLHSPPPGFNNVTSPPGLLKSQPSPPKPTAAIGGRGKFLQMLAKPTTPQPVMKPNHDPFFGEKTQYDFPSDKELLQTPNVAPMVKHGPLIGERVSVVKKFTR